MMTFLLCLGEFYDLYRYVDFIQQLKHVCV